MSYVYIVSQNGQDFPCKVGMSNSPESRLASLQSGSSSKLALRELYWMGSRAAAARLERKFHDSHAEVRMNGEWFGVSFEDANSWLFLHTVDAGVAN